MSTAASASAGTPVAVVPIGREVEPGVHIEQIGQARWMVRCTTDARAPLRVGEVMGGRRKFLACRLNGDVIGIAKTLRDAALTCAKARSGEAPRA